MQGEGVIEKYKDKKVWCLILKDYTKTSLAYRDQIGNQKLFTYYEIFGQEDARRVKYAPQQEKERVIRNGESYLFMCGAKIECLLGEKVSLQDTESKLPGNSYYTSREVKFYDDFVTDYDKNKMLNTTRMNGLAVTNGGGYVVYDVNRSLPNFTYGEMKIRTYCETLLAKKNWTTLKGGIILSNDMETMKKYIRPVSAEKQNQLLRLESAYDHIYSLTLDKTGQRMMQIMSMYNWDKEMYKNMLADIVTQNTVDEYCAVECDACTGDTYYFVFCVPDIKRFKQFLYRADYEKNPKRYRIICFDYQAEMLKDVAGQSCMILSTKFENYYNYIRRNGDVKSDESID